MQPFVHIGSSANLIITTFGFEFSIHTASTRQIIDKRQCELVRVPVPFDPLACLGEIIRRSSQRTERRHNEIIDDAIETPAEALSALFMEPGATPAAPAATTGTLRAGHAADRARKALDRYNLAMERLKSGDWTGFSTELEAMRGLLEDMSRQIERPLGHHRRNVHEVKKSILIFEWEHAIRLPPQSRFAHHGALPVTSAQPI